MSPVDGSTKDKVGQGGPRLAHVSHQGEGRLNRMVSRPNTGKAREDGKIELRQKDCYGELGFAFPARKKWWILSVIFVIQCSMNCGS